MTNKGSILSTAIAVVGELIIYQVLKMMMMADDDDDEHICSEFLKLILSLFLVFSFFTFLRIKERQKKPYTRNI